VRNGAVLCHQRCPRSVGRKSLCFRREVDTQRKGFRNPLSCRSKALCPSSCDFQAAPCVEPSTGPTSRHGLHPVRNGNRTRYRPSEVARSDPWESLETKARWADRRGIPRTVDRLVRGGRSVLSGSGSGACLGRTRMPIQPRTYRCWFEDDWVNRPSPFLSWVLKFTRSRSSEVAGRLSWPRGPTDLRRHSSPVGVRVHAVPHSSAGLHVLDRVCERVGLGHDDLHGLKELAQRHVLLALHRAVDCVFRLIVITDSARS